MDAWCFFARAGSTTQTQVTHARIDTETDGSMPTASLLFHNKWRLALHN